MTNRLCRSSSLCLLIAGGLLAILSARPAEAAPVGPSANGLTANGLTANGLTANGLTANGLTANGLGVNGLSDNGLGVNGVKQNGIKQNGIAPLVDPLASRRFSNPDHFGAGALRITAIVLRHGHRLEGR